MRSLSANRNKGNRQHYSRSTTPRRISARAQNYFYMCVVQMTGDRLFGITNPANPDLFFTSGSRRAICATALVIAEPWLKKKIAISGVLGVLKCLAENHRPQALAHSKAT